MKKETRINDLTHEEMTSYILVSIEKPGMMIEYPKGDFSTRLTLEIEEKDLGRVMGHIKFVPKLGPIVTIHEEKVNGTGHTG